MIRLFASDLDGTLLQYGSIDPETLDQVRSFRARGNLFGIRSGRDLPSLREKLQNNNLEYDFLVAMSGVYIEFKGRILREIPMVGYRHCLPFLEEFCVFMFL